MSREVMQQAIEKIDRALKTVSELCDGIRRWTMSVPAQPDHDPDLVIAGALSAARDALREALARTEFLSTNEAVIAQLIEERDVREDILDKVFDMVLGTDRPEWSSRYQYIDAVEDVREALAQPARAPTYSELDRIASDLQALCDQQAMRLGALEAQPEKMARLGWQYVECPACGSEGARAFPKPEEQLCCDKQEPVAWIDDDGNLQRDEPPYSYGPDPRPLYLAPPQRQPLTGEKLGFMVLEHLGPAALTGGKMGVYDAFILGITEAEAAHGIKEKNT